MKFEAGHKVQIRSDFLGMIAYGAVLEDTGGETVKVDTTWIRAVEKGQVTRTEYGGAQDFFRDLVEEVSLESPLGPLPLSAFTSEKEADGWSRVTGLVEPPTKKD